MTVSYSANFEDVILQRVFAHLHGGFYIDVGAGSPVETSNTFALYYHQHWRGIAIDPLISLFEDQWKLHRPGDVTFVGCAGQTEGLVPFWVCRAGQLSTGASATLDHWRSHGSKINSNDFNIVSQVSLNKLMEMYTPPEFHLLCIDVEGMESAVLAGLDLSRHRPWVMCIECMVPATTIENMPWESSILAKGYRRVYEDAVNSWYLAEEHGELAAKFRYGPNYTDFITTYREVLLTYEIRKLRGEVK